MFIIIIKERKMNMHQTMDFYQSLFGRSQMAFVFMTPAILHSMVTVKIHSVSNLSKYLHSNGSRQTFRHTQNTNTSISKSHNFTICILLGDTNGPPKSPQLPIYNLKIIKLLNRNFLKVSFSINLFQN